MKYSNRHNLPEAVFNALCRDEYNKGSSDYSVTELLNPPQLVQLRRRYGDQIEEDVMDNVWSIFGKAAHHILEGHAPEDSLSEERLYVEVLGRKVGGQVDNYHNKVISDYKITSAWTLVYGSRIHEWEEQLNSYAYIFRKNGHEVDKLQIITILRDWDKNRAAQDRQYPQTPIVVLPITLWSEEEQYNFLEWRVSGMVACESYSDKDLACTAYQCSSVEMWEQPSKYAVMKEGRKTAVRVLDTYKEAMSYMDVNRLGADIGYYLQNRPGKRTRCQDYCPVSKFCFQYKKYLEEQSEK